MGVSTFICGPHSAPRRRCWLTRPRWPPRWRVGLVGGAPDRPAPCPAWSEGSRLEAEPVSPAVTPSQGLSRSRRRTRSTASTVALRRAERLPRVTSLRRSASWQVEDLRPSQGRGAWSPTQPGGSKHHCRMRPRAGRKGQGAQGVPAVPARPLRMRPLRQGRGVGPCDAGRRARALRAGGGVSVVRG